MSPLLFLLSVCGVCLNALTCFVTSHVAQICLRDPCQIWTFDLWVVSQGKTHIAKQTDGKKLADVLLDLNCAKEEESLNANLDAVALLQILGHGFGHGFKEEPGVL